MVWSTGTGTRPEYLILKLRDEEHVLVVVELKKAAEETDAGMGNVEAKLLEYIEDRFSKTRYPTIYGIGGIGFSWTVLKVDRAGSNEPTKIVPWRGHVTSNRSYLLFKNVADEIHDMSAQVCPKSCYMLSFKFPHRIRPNPPPHPNSPRHLRVPNYPFHSSLQTDCDLLAHRQFVLGM